MADGSIRSLSDLRAYVGDAGKDLSDEQLMAGFAKTQGVDPVHVANEFGYDPGKGSMNRERVSGAIDDYQSGLYGVLGAATRAVGGTGEWADKQRDSNQFQSDVAKSRAHAAGSIDSYHDVNGVGDAANYATGLAIGSAAPMLEMAGGAALGAATGGLAAPALLAARGIRGAEALAAGARGIRSGGQLVGAVAGDYPVALSDILQNQREAGGEDFGSAALGAVPYTAIDTGTGLGRLAGKLKLPRNPAASLDVLTGVKGGLARAGASAAKVGLEEGAGEVGQELINQGAGRMAVNPNLTLTDPDAIERYKESFVGGAALGGIIGGGAGGWRRGAHGAPQTNPDAEVADALQGAPAAPPITLPTPTAPDEAPAGRAGANGRPLPSTASFTAPAGPSVAPEQAPAAPGPGAITQSTDPQALDVQAAINAAAEEHAGRRQRAHDALVDNDPATGKPAITLKPTEVVLFHEMSQLNADGRLDNDTFASMAGAIKEALYTNDRPAINAVRKAVEEIKNPKPAKAVKEQTSGTAQPDVQPAPGVAPAAAPVASDNSAGSGGAVGLLPANPAGPGPGGPVAPGGDVRPNGPVGVGAAGAPSPVAAIPGLPKPRFQKAPKPGAPPVAKSSAPRVPAPAVTQFNNEGDLVSAIAKENGVPAPIADAYWQHKNEGTSLSKLAAGLGMAKSSLHDVFVPLAEKVENAKLLRLNADAAETVHDQEVTHAPEEHTAEAPATDQTHVADETDGEMGAETNTSGTLKETGDLADEANRNVDTGEDNHLQGLTISNDHHGEGKTKADNDPAADKAYKAQRKIKDPVLKARWDALTKEMPKKAQVTFDKLGEGQKLMFEQGIHNGDAAEAHIAVSESVSADKMRFSENQHGAFEVHGATGEIHGVDKPAAPSDMHGPRMDAVKEALPVDAMTQPHTFAGKHETITFAPLKPSQRYSIAAAYDTLARSALAPMIKLASGFIKRVGVLASDGKYKNTGAMLAPDGTLGFGEKYLPRDLMSASVDMVQHVTHELTHALDRMAGKMISGHPIEASLLPDSPTLATFDIKMNGASSETVITPKMNPVMKEILKAYVADESNPAMRDFDQSLLTLTNQIEALARRDFKLGEQSMEVLEGIFEVASTELTPKLMELYAANPESLRAYPLAYAHAEALAKATTAQEAAAVFQGHTNDEVTTAGSASQESGPDQGSDRSAQATADAAGDRGVHADVSRNPDASARDVAGAVPGPSGQLGGEGPRGAGSDLDAGRVRHSAKLGDAAPPIKDGNRLIAWAKSHLGGFRTNPSLLGWLTTEQLGTAFKELPAVAAFSRSMQRMGGAASQMMHVSDAITRSWDKLQNSLGEGQRASFDSLVNRSTRTQIWPDRPLDHPSQSHLDVADPKVIAEHKALEHAWSELPAGYKTLFAEMQADHLARFNRYVAAQTRLITRTFYPLTHENSASVATQAQVDQAASLDKGAREAFMEANATSKSKADTFSGLFDALDAQSKLSQLEGPYAPQSRFGDHIVSYKAPEYIRAEKLLAEANEAIQNLHQGDHAAQIAELDTSIAGDTAKHKRATSDARRAQLAEDIADAKAERAELAKPMEAAKELLAKRTADLNAMKSDTNAYNVEFFENRGQAVERHAQLEAFFGKDGTEVTRTMRDQFLNDQDAITPAYVKKIEEHLTANMTGANADEIKRSVREMYLQHLPGTSSLKSQIKRKNVPGIKDAEAKRSFAAKAMKDAYGISRLEHAPDLHDSMSSLRTASDEDSKLVGNELAKRMAQNFTAKSNGLINFAANLTYATQLGMSPSFMLMQGTQQWVITAPIMAARHGIANASSLLARGTADASKMVKLAFDKASSKMDMQVNIPDSVKAGIITEEEGKVLQDMMDRGRIDITSQHDLGIATDPNAPLDTFTRAAQMASWPAQQLETINRVSTALAGYRAEKASRIKGGATVAEAQQKAAQYADKLVSETHMNYNTENRARFLHPSNWGGWGKVMYQFRGYQQGMAYLTAKNMVDAVRGDKEAMKAVGYLLGVQAATAGMAGMPIPGAMVVAATMLYKSWKDDDEEQDLKENFYQGVKSVGGESLANLVTGGVPALLGVNIASKIGMGNTFDVAPFVNTNGKNGKDSTAAYFLAAAGGPSGGTVANWVDALMQINHGDYAKAAMTALPKAMSDVVKAYGYEADGTSDKRGNTILRPEDISATATALRAVGLQSQDVQRTMDQRSAFFEARQNIKDVRAKLLADYARERMAGKDTSDIMEKVQAFNERHPDAGTKIAQGQLQLSVVKRREFEKNLVGGVPVGKRDKALAKDLGIGD